jgi:hypothetical protein
MSWVITGKEAGPADSFIGSVSLLLHGDGTNGSTTIIDSSPSPKTVTAVGDAQISTAQSKFGGASIAFDGVGDQLNIGGLSAWSRFTGPSVTGTIEFWLYLNALPSVRAQIVGAYGTAADSGWTIDINSAGNGFISRNNSGVTITLSSKFTTGSWQFWQITSDGTTITFYKDGASVGSTTESALFNASAAPKDIRTVSANFRVGLRSDNVLPLNGYIDELRLTFGVIRPNAVPTAPFPDI